MEDFDEVEEQNEEDLLDLGDSFATINLKVTILSLIYLNNTYRTTCWKHSTIS